ncbi:fluoride efflux transporter CrcB [Microbacterium candidum]|uniref:Fluoride-specific ion channel FluC n=1 Tax=Microbacterium candidum TaxID=3041922 RepID=A0ABT7MTC6_9MICO|nr:fluoride efflux transporter CrcB [Microbacterium sp. ASV49]MDL9977712.1 fluoride efflux transporter CrcB [Microbacterium sp. ASV49]
MTGPLTILLLCIAGGVGAALRFTLDGAVKARVHTVLPPGTMLINVLGAFVLGIVTAVTGTLISPDAELVLGTGLLGGFTTFSTASLETVTLARAGHWGRAAANGFGMLILALAAAALGLWLGSLWAG